MIDDQTTAYILAAQTYFEDLKLIAAQLAGFLVLAAAGSKSATPDHPLLGSAEQLCHYAAEGLRTIRVSKPARTHHDYLLAALAGLNAALSSIKASCDPLRPLEAAYADLRSAARSLPGFEIVSFERCCCHSQALS